MFEPDAIDWKIIDILRKEIKSNSALAKELDVSEGMIRQRLRRLKEAGIIKLKALINPDTLTNRQLTLIGISVSESYLLESKADEISRLENVLSVSITSGRYDLFAEVLVDSNKGLVQFLTKELAKVKGISKTESFLMLKNYNLFV